MVWASAATAQGVPIRSGEHEDFTRLVLTLPAQEKWTLSKDEGSTVLEFERPFQFETAKVFDRIPRDRLVDVRQSSPGRLRLDLGCACELSTFWHSPTMLVIDIAEGNTKANLIKPRLRPEVEERTPDDSVAQVKANAIWPRTKPSVTLTKQSLTWPSPMDVPEASAQTEEKLSQPGTLHQKRAQIMKQLGRAASQGLLSPSAQFPKTKPPDVQKADPAQDQPLDKAPKREPVKTEHDPRNNMRAQSSIDRDFLSHARKMNGVTSDGRNCLPEALVRVSDWGTDAPFGTQIGPLNTRLYGEFDKPDEKTALALARLYVFFGFGAEAQRALRLAPKPSQDKDIVRAMASILRDGQAQPDSVLSNQMDCTTSIAVWSVLSYPALPSELPIDTDAVLRGLSGLPPHLRRYLGPILSQRFLAVGQTETANRILRILERGTESNTPQIGMAKAELELAEGDITDAGKTLDEVVEQGAEPSARALVRRIETLWSAGDDISFEMAQLAAAYASENRDAPIQKDLLWAQVVALAASGAFHQAFEEIERIESNGGEARDGLKNDVMGRLAQKADDLEFLQYALPPASGASPEVEPAVGNAIATRFLDLGFAQPASVYLDGSTVGTAQRDRQILRARLALQEGRPRRAEVELLDLTGPKANLLRAQARGRLGQHAAAAQLFASAGQDDAARAQAWLAEDWEHLAADPESKLREVADFMTSPPEAPEATAGPLRQSRDLLGESDEVRKMLRSLLEDRALDRAEE
jgi:hypothetical protein